MFHKFTLQSLANKSGGEGGGGGGVNQPFILFIHHVRGETVL